ncbi:hypothetical protein DMJ13_25560 [halophilic archaeon]|nr:hypothetical protein DMJ13_25560 [halophilic archaeon]
MERVLLTDHNKFSKYRFEDLSGEFASEGLLLTEGDQWRRQRTAIQSASTLDRIQGYGNMIAQYANELVTSWDDGEEVALNRAFSRLTLQVLAQSLVDLELSQDASIVTEFPDVLNN